MRGIQRVVWNRSIYRCLVIVRDGYPQFTEYLRHTVIAFAAVAGILRDKK